ncbi:hypothetical protein QBC34DRAFT_13661 [Podospora aff. communis PSN243]|uniref:Transcription factor Iwr1 domain-containing protein n=1 Tax=Podospora aff. communis PSN243 TaxID=3040156 RepID=A0AAV9H695_9PEZI|nr:hypothetical protein QBC34DRAFT_13661 [Podospora aff. communis PSN243]
MSMLPPETIQVKRKRGADADEGPVDFLRVEGNKRFRSVSGDASWVYQRKQVKLQADNPAAAPAPPVILPTHEGDENRPIKSLRKPTAKSAAITAPAPKPLESQDAANERVRRFHLSKEQLSLPAVAATTSRKRGAAAVFVERSAKKQKENAEPKTPTLPQTPAASSSNGPADAVLDERPSTPTSPERMAAAAAAQRPSQSTFKRPGARARTNKQQPAKRPSLPLSLLNRDGADMDELARDMEAYTLSQITANLDRMDLDSAKARAFSQSLGSARSSRFKPKAPATRFAERHPEYVAERERAKGAATSLVMDEQSGDSTDDEDYVMETYERVPASRLRDQAVPPHRVGLLVFDTEPEHQEFFFGNEGDSSDEFPEDDEDENGRFSQVMLVGKGNTNWWAAENYYTADYPDEDLDWDDQFDRNPYRFATGNGSDVDEHDDDDDDESDLDDDEPWEKIRGEVRNVML